MANGAAEFRMERIEKLLRELEYEVSRGMMGNEIDESIQFSFYVPISRSLSDGVVHCEFRTRPIRRYQMGAPGATPRLKIVKS
jgi:hypothetical protein